MGEVIRTWSNDKKWDALASDATRTKEADVYGTIAMIDSIDPDQRTATISYPDNQVYAEIYIGTQICPERKNRAFIRGDADGSYEFTLDAVDMTDAIFILRALFLGEKQPTCEDAADVDDNGVIDMSDAIYLLLHLFSGGEKPPAPYPAPAGFDMTFDNLGCKCYGASCM